MRPPGVDEGSVLTVFRATPADAGQRLDVFLVGQLRRTSRTRAQRIILLSAHDATGRRLRPNHRVKAEERVLLWRAPWDDEPAYHEIRVLFEDDWMMAVDKPPFLPVHPTARYSRNPVIKILEAERPGAFLSLVHRIDRETSGVLLLGKTPDADRALKMQLEARVGVEKRYLAITWGVPRGSTGHGPGWAGNAFRCDLSMKLDPTSSTKVKMCLAEDDDAMSAGTVFQVLDTRTGVNGRTYALVQCDLETGRQHQIRLHLASLGAPIVGDKLYGPDEGLFARGADGELTEDDARVLELPRHALHATRLALAHPVSAERFVVEAPLPADLVAFYEGL